MFRKNSATRINKPRTLPCYSTNPLPDCWGHRGASSRFPENTLASFEAAMRDGAEGIESGISHWRSHPCIP
ncbi:hypothetical protein BDQ17DRAFT_1359825 [Cyathus striatus]|nr:hypothetical protein BDQ17DRAFT_1359825 [Cyathus striatus]